MGSADANWQDIRSALPFEIGLYSAASVGEKIYILGKNICSLVFFDTTTLTFDTLATFQPYVQRVSPILCLKDAQTLIIVSGRRKDDESEDDREVVQTRIEEFDVNKREITKYYDLEWVINNPQVVSVPYYPKFK